MTSSDQINTAPAMGETPAQTATESSPVQSVEPPELPVTREQAEQILNELKSIKQNIFWLLLVAGFFAARSFFFHY